ncbi:unnamed protein product, partial [Rotaria sordida]
MPSNAELNSEQNGATVKLSGKN